MTRRVGDDVVILDVTSGRYYSLDGVGALIWDRLEQDTSREALVDAIVETFDVDRAQASADLDELLDDLTDRGLVDR